MLAEPLLTQSPSPKHSLLVRLCGLGILLVTAAAAAIWLLQTSPGSGNGYGVLVTGYGPFRNVTRNPSGEVARLLNGSCSTDGSTCIHSVVLDVSSAGASLPAEILRRSGRRWRAVIHLGVESVAKGLKIEVAAANVAAREDGPGWSAGHECERTIEASGPCLLAATAPLNLEALDLPLPGLPDGSSRVAELWSRDAGAYYCNEVFYRTLSAVRGDPITGGFASSATPLGTLLPVIFIHLPLTRVAPLPLSAEFVLAVAAQLSGTDLMSPVYPDSGESSPDDDS